MTARLTKYQEEGDGFDEIHNAHGTFRLESPNALLVNASLHRSYYFHVLSSDPNYLNTQFTVPKADIFQRNV